MNLKTSLTVLAAALAATSFSQVTGNFRLDQSGILGTNVGSGFVGLSHDTFTPSAGNGPAYSFYGFCTDLTVVANWDTDYADTKVNTNSFYKLNQSPNVDAKLGSEISSIANKYGFTHSADVATAAQLAIWEVQGMSLSDVQGHLGANFSTLVADDAASYVTDAQTAYANGARSVSPWYESPFTSGSNQLTQNFVQPVPEPSTLLMGLGIVGLVLRRRTKR